MQTGLSKYADTHSPIFEDMKIRDLLELKDGTPIILNEDHSISVVFEYFGVNIPAKEAEGYIRSKLLHRFDKLFADIQETKITISFTKFFGAEKEVEIPEGALVHEIERIKKYNNSARERCIKSERFFASVNIAPSREREVGKIKLALINTKLFLNKELTKDEKYMINRAAFSDMENRTVAISRISGALKDTLTECDIRYKMPSNKQELFNILLTFSLPRDHNEVEIKYDSSESVRRQIFSSEKIRRSHKGFFLNGYFHRVYTLDDLPEYNVYFGELEQTLLSMPYEFFYTISTSSLSKTETDKVFAATWRKKKIADMEWGKNQKRVDKEERDLETEEEVAIEDGTSLSRVSAMIVIKVPEYRVEEECQKQSISFERYIDDLDHELKTRYFKDFGNSRWQPEENGHFYFFSKAFIGCNSTFSEDSLLVETKRSDVPFLIPFTSLARRDLRQDGLSFYYSKSSNSGVPGGAIAFDHFDKRLKAPNWEIFGSTGSGKSVLIQSLMTAFMGKRFQGSDVIIRGTDIGGAVGSYEKFVEMYGGKILRFKGRQKPNINILSEINPEKSRPKEDFLKKVSEEIIYEKLNGGSDSITHEESLNLAREIYGNLSNREDEDYKMNKDFLYYFKDVCSERFDVKLSLSKEEEEMVKLSPGNCLPEEDDLDFIMMLMDTFLTPGSRPGGGFEDGIIDEDFISSVVLKTYELLGDRFPSISDVRDTLEKINDIEEPDPSITNMIESLGNWTRDGKYPYFDLPTNVEFDNPVIIADMNDLISSDSDKVSKISSAYVNIITKIFVDDLFRKRDKARMFLGDENWKVAKSSPKMRGFLESIKRLARKYGFFNINATQGALDYAPFPDFMSAVKENTFGYLIPGMDSSSVDKVCDYYGWGDGIREKLKKDVGLKETDDGRGGTRKSFGRALMIMKANSGVEDCLVDNILTPTEFQLYHSDDEEGAIHTFYLKRREMGIAERIEFIKSEKYAFDDELLDYLKSSGKQDVVFRIEKIRKEREEEENKKDNILDF
jgi:ABC-type multidrug transport system fused ATPase/permease subunit